MPQQQEGQRKGACGHEQQDPAQVIEGQAGTDQHDPADSACTQRGQRAAQLMGS